MTRAIVFSLLAASLALASCAGRAPDDVDGPVTGHPQNEAPTVTEARSLFPRTIDMHQRIVARSCAPNAGVCHNTSNYPDLTTTGGLLQAVNAWCNLETPDPTQGFDLCERTGDLVVVEGAMITEIAWMERDSLDHWRIGLRDPAPVAIAAGRVYFYTSIPDAPVLLPAEDWGVQLDVDVGGAEATLSINGVTDNPFIEGYIDGVLASVVGGDPNRNGTFGADAHADDELARVIEPGSLARSYLWGRITGTVPGSRMPLANQALSDAEYVAVACFIETLARNPSPPTAEDPIDYDNCDFAKAPVSLAVLTP